MACHLRIIVMHWVHASRKTTCTVLQNLHWQISPSANSSKANAPDGDRGYSANASTADDWQLGALGHALGVLSRPERCGARFG